MLVRADYSRQVSADDRQCGFTVALIDGVKEYLKYSENRWVVVKHAANSKKQAEKWEVPPPAPRWEIPIHGSRANELVQLKQESGARTISSGGIDTMPPLYGSRPRSIFSIPCS